MEIFCILAVLLNIMVVIGYYRKILPLRERVKGTWDLSVLFLTTTFEFIIISKFSSLIKIRPIHLSSGGNRSAKK